MFKNFKKNIRRSPYQSLVVVINVALTLFLVCIFFLIGVGSQALLGFFESRPQAIAYLKDTAKPEEIELLKSKLESNGQVSKVNYVSKGDALKIYQELFKDKPVLLEMVTAKFLPASLEVSTVDIASLKDVANVLRQKPFIEDVDFQEDVVSTLSLWLNNLRKFGLALAVFLLFNSVLTILVILGMRISKRKEEIEILKLIGASPGYIRVPIYLEGVFYGMVSAIFAWGFSYILILYLTPSLKQFFNGIPLLPVDPIFMLELLGGLTILGMVVGFLGSFFAVSRFIAASR